MFVKQKLHVFLSVLTLLGMTAVPGYAQLNPINQAIGLSKSASTAARTTTSVTAEEYYGKYYIWNQDNLYGGATTLGRIELTAEGGTFQSNNFSAAFSWTVTENGLVTLNFDNVVEFTSFEYDNSTGQSFEFSNILTQIQLQRTFTETNEQLRMDFTLSKSGFTRYANGAKPDKPYDLSSSEVTATKTAGLLDPTPFIKANMTVAIPVEDAGTVKFSSELQRPDVGYPRHIVQLRFSEVNGTNGTLQLEKATVEQNGELGKITNNALWQIQQNHSVTILVDDGSKFELFFLGFGPGNQPIVQVKYQTANSTTAAVVPSRAFWMEKTLNLSQNDMAEPVFLELRQSGIETYRFWFEFMPSGIGRIVSADDANTNGEFSDNEIRQEPTRWQVNNGVLEIRRYRYNPTSGKSGLCIPADFAPAPTGECVVDTMRSYHVMNNFAHNNEELVSILNVQRNLDSSRRPTWPDTNILRSVLAMDGRILYRTKQRPIVIKPTVAGVAIEDDVLRQCLEALNPVRPEDVTHLNCIGDVRSLNGIEKFTQLSFLNIVGSNRLSLIGLDRLKSLPGMTGLYLSNLLIGDTEFAKLSGWQTTSPITLHLQGIGLSNLSYNVIDSFNVELLTLTGPLDLMPLTGLPNQVTLNKLYGLIIDSLPFANLTTELERLKLSTSLTLLSLSRLNLTTMPVALPANVRYFSLSGEKIASLDPAKLNPDKLMNLTLSSSEITSLEFIKQLPKLRNLELQGITLADWSPLTQPLPQQLSILQASANSNVSCAIFSAIAQANPTMRLIYDICASTSPQRYQLQLPENLTATAVQFDDSQSANQGSLSLADGQLIFTPAANTYGWIAFLVRVTLSDGSTKHLVFRTYVQPPNKRTPGLPWWVLTVAPKN